MSTYDTAIQDHYRQQADQHGLEPTSTMADLVTRQKEINAILEALACINRPGMDVLEIGCGNGYLLEQMRQRFPAYHLYGLDYSSDMMDLARQRQIPDCRIESGDVRKLGLIDRHFDIVVSERCLINLLDRADQHRAFTELHRVIMPGGYLVMIEAFMDGLDNLNRAREQLGLPPNKPPEHNLWFRYDELFREIGHLFEPVSLNEVVDPMAIGGPLPDSNFLSSHYFISRVLYPAITKAPIVYNSELVRFFSDMTPRGDYSPIQLYVLRRL